MSGFSAKSRHTVSQLFSPAARDAPKEGTQERPHRQGGFRGQRPTSFMGGAGSQPAQVKDPSMTDLSAAPPLVATHPCGGETACRRSDKNPPPQVCDRFIWPACQNLRRNVGSTFALERNAYADALRVRQSGDDCAHVKNIQAHRTNEIAASRALQRIVDQLQRRCFLPPRTTD